jgi:NADH-quinone oxidoreductase subunit N
MNLHAVLVGMLPEHLLLAGIVGTMLAEIAGRRNAGSAIALLAVLAALAAAIWMAWSGVATTPFPGHLAIDRQALAGKLLVLGLAVPVLLVSRDDFRDTRFHALLLCSLYGASLVPASASFTTLFLALELMSLPVYVLVLIGMQRPGGSEAALKYLVLGSTATATLLMGISLLWGSTGSMAITAFTEGLAGGQTIATAGAMLVLLALMLKAAIVPFHAWAPDAYEAASVPITAHMTTIVKSGVLLAALAVAGPADLPAPLLAVVATLALASMVWGNLAASVQTGFRRLYAYSSIAHAGYLWFAFLGAGDGRAEAIVYYLVAYALVGLVVFGALPRSDHDADGDRLTALHGLFHRRPLAAILIAAAMLSLAGLPPLPGFVAKFLVFANVLAAGHVALAVLGLVASYIGLYAYLRVVQALFMAEAPADAGATPRRLAWLALALTALPAAWLMVQPSVLLALL